MSKLITAPNLPLTNYIVIATAAAYQPSPGFGSYAAILHLYAEGKRVREIELTGGEMRSHTTRLEMLALRAGLQKISRNQELPIFVRVNNSTIAQAMNEWRHKWVENGWRNAKNSLYLMPTFGRTTSRCARG